MSIQGTGARRRSTLSAALVALALIVAVFVLATQANSIGSTRTGARARPVPAHLAPSANLDLGTSSHISAGCRRPKYGCQQGGNTIAERPYASRDGKKPRTQTTPAGA
jgi:hypothetical protein